MLVLDGTTIRAAVHGRRPDDGQGRRALVPCAAESGDLSREGRDHDMGPPPQLSRLLGTQALGALGRW